MYSLSSASQILEPLARVNARGIPIDLRDVFTPPGIWSLAKSKTRLDLDKFKREFPKGNFARLFFDYSVYPHIMVQKTLRTFSATVRMNFLSQLV
jgi:hypothetical protein